MNLKNSVITDCQDFIEHMTHHSNIDMFVADALNATIKDDMPSMMDPIFALRAGDKSIRRYKLNGRSIEIMPSVKGLATIFDKDILIYCISHLIHAQNTKKQINKTIQIKAHDLLISTNRPTDGDSYARLHDAFDRLVGTRVKTNVESGNRRIKKWFGLIENVEIIEKSPDNTRMIAIRITLSDWIFFAIVSNDVVTINQDYFKLRKSLERRFYEIARKHCGNKLSWLINLDILHKKTGSTSTHAEFRRLIKGIINRQKLPEFLVTYDVALDKVIFYKNTASGRKKLTNDSRKKNPGQLLY